MGGGGGGWEGVPGGWQNGGDCDNVITKVHSL